MGRRRKNSGAEGAIGFVVLLLIGLITLIPKEVWIALGGLAIFGAILYFVSRSGSQQTEKVIRPLSDQKPATPPTTKIAKQPSTATRGSASDRSSPESTLVSVGPLSTPNATDGFKLPVASASRSTAKWIPPGQTLEVRGHTLRDTIVIPGGMIYYGSSLPSGNGTDPCLIDPRDSVAAAGDYTQRQFGYWPSYGEISPSARRAYLKWLATGRRAPDAEIGYVFLFFYGLERRVLIDTPVDPSAKQDWPAIVTELRQLLDVYGARSGSFKRYADSLLDWMSVEESGTALYLRPVPVLAESYELPNYVRLALGQAAADDAPLPGPLALAWLKLSPETYLRTPATRCPEEFDRLFLDRYEQTFGAGMKLPRNRTKLKIVYMPASAGFRGSKEMVSKAGSLPDVSVLTGPIEKLRTLATSVTEELDSYSRLLGKNPSAKASLEAALLLPSTLWPKLLQENLQKLFDRMIEGRLDLTLGELLSALGATGAASRELVIGLARALEARNIAMEPDVLGGARVPKADQTIVLFLVPAGEPPARDTEGYAAAALTLQLSAVVASADGRFCETEEIHLREQVAHWTHLVPSQQRRLIAHLHWLTFTTVNPTTLKQKVGALTAEAREALGAFMVKVALADGTILPAEVKALEKIYKLLGLDPAAVFSAVHGASAGAKPASAAPVPKTTKARFTLDAARVAELQRDTEKVSAMLSNIFVEDEPPPAIPAPVAADDDAPSSTVELLWGLDEAHSALARALMRRSSWSRSELVDIAADLDLMADGALERINEAAYEAVDQPLIEGEDPIEINLDILEQLTA